jgi:hypothetical protein
MTNTAKVLILLCGIHVASFSAYCVDNPKKPCTRQEAMAAENDVDNSKNWDSLYKSYQRFSHCDDGAIAEGYSDDVGNLLANNWEEFPKLAKLAHANHGFQRFVIKHVDDTVPADTLKKIYENAKSHCPAGEGQLCRLIASSAK